ncbi:iron uptake transporter deferrochelatase/peroxidase subunit [Angustibacter aerolatus]
MAGPLGAAGGGADVTSAAARVDFHGPHQAGIDTPSQDRLAFAAFDVVTDDAEELRRVLTEWSQAAVAMTRGVRVPGDSVTPALPPADTGEAVGLPASALTVTVGFGPDLFDHRFGLAAKRPSRLAPLPALPGDELQPQRTGGDLAIQACSHDPQVAFHAIRNLARIGSGVVALRWTQLGFGRTSSTTRAQATPRNLMGFKDGTRNIKAEDTDLMADHVWVGDDEPQAWMHGGSYLVARRIRMLIESWDRAVLQEQETVIGRHKASGAPLAASDEFDELPLDAKGADGQPVVPVDAHVRLASPQANGGLQILRRGFSYTDGIDEGGLLDAGLFFISFQRDPEHFITLQRRLGTHDALNEYIKHVGSGVWAVPPGLPDDTRTWADHLFA